jgi:hypothetical protein
MPRNGDGSSDNGPIDGHEIIHGTTGDVRTPFSHTEALLVTTGLSYTIEKNVARLQVVCK